MGQRVLIVGGVAGGATAAARLRRLSEEFEIIIFERGEHISYANCGLPYYIGNVITQRESLLVQTPEGMKVRYNIEVRVRSEVVGINRGEHKITVKDLNSGQEYQEGYDFLILAPGAAALRPPIPGLAEAANAFTLRSISDMDQIKRFIEVNKPQQAVVVGGGFSGLEMVENLQGQGMKVSLVEMLDQVLAPLDFEMAAIMHNQLRQHGVELLLGDGVKSFQENGRKLELASGRVIPAELIILAMGVKPEVDLAQAAGLKIGERGGIVVDEFLRTEDAQIYAIGDAIEVKDYILGSQTRVPLAWPANRQARLAADNIAGRQEAYPGSLGTAIVKVFELTAGVTGANEKRLQAAGVEYKVLHIHPGAHAGYYPGATPLSLKLLFAPDGRILGAQAVGEQMADKKIDVIATAIKGGLKVQDLPDLELAYAPQFSSAKDAVNLLGYVAADLLEGLVENVQWHELQEVVSSEPGKAETPRVFILDVREEAEVVLGIIPGAMNIPLPQLRSRLSELPKDKEIWVYCQVGLRGYIAARLLIQTGFKVKNIDGGYRTYAAVFAPETATTATADSGEAILPATAPAQLAAAGPQVAISTAAAKEVTIKQVVDASGLQCPGPLQRVYETLKTLAEGEVIEAIATDPAFHVDIRKWCERTGNLVLAEREEQGKYYITVQKGQGVSQGVKLHNNDEENKLTMIIFDGDLDKAIAAFIIANGAAAFGKEVVLFFTFWGLNVIRRPNRVRVEKSLIERMFGWMMPRGAAKLDLSHMNMAGLGPIMIKSIMKQKNVSSLPELMAQAQAQGVRLVACTMSMDVMGIKQEELIDGVELGGVASYLGEADTAGINMFV